MSFERHDLVDAAEFDRFLGHSEDYAGGFVLGDVDRAGLLHLQHSARAVVAHAGEDHANRILPGIAGGGAEQHIDRGPVAANQRAVLDLNVVARAAALEQQVMIAGRNERAAANARCRWSQPL